MNSQKQINPFQLVIQSRKKVTQSHGLLKPVLIVSIKNWPLTFPIPLDRTFEALELCLYGVTFAA
jgi:hypothetical protein